MDFASKNKIIPILICNVKNRIMVSEQIQNINIRTECSFSTIKYNFSYGDLVVRLPKIIVEILNEKNISQIRKYFYPSSLRSYEI